MKERQAGHWLENQAVELLAGLLALAPSRIRVEALPGGSIRADAVLDVGGHRFVVETKTAGGAGPVALAAERAQSAAKELGKGAIPLVIVPYMGDAGRQRCQALDVGWADLSGNAHIVAPGLRIIIEGKPNRFTRRGRPSSAFAPKSSRIARWLLINPQRALTQRELARATDLDEGFTSKIVRRLEADELVRRQDDGTILPRDPDALLDALAEAYDFSKHDILRGHIAARTGQDLLRQVSRELSAANLAHAATGLSAAWLLAHFAAFRLVTVYVKSTPHAEWLDKIGFREDPRGANLWLVVPRDEGVFHGASEHDGIPCVHPVQAYLDLQAQPERAKEAAEQLRDRYLSWSAHG